MLLQSIRPIEQKRSIVLLVCLAPTFAVADVRGSPERNQKPGLIWNRSGLPAVFPLQVKTLSGRDFVLTLVDEDTRLEALAAYIVGGAFFKVLVPPGTYTLRFSYGDVWQGEEHLFGAGADVGSFELQQALTFAVRGGGTKAGHLVDLTDMQEDEVLQVRVKGQFICQAVRTEIFPPLEARYAPGSRIQNEAENVGSRPSMGEDRTLSDAQYLGRSNRHFSYLRFEMRSRYCD